MLRTLAIAAAMLVPLAAQAQDIVRHKTPNSDFPILQAVEIPPGRTVVYLSGTVPGIADPAGDSNTSAAWGNMQTQTVSVLNAIDAQLSDLGLGMGDVVKMQAFLVAPESGPVDFDGFMAGYGKFFGTEAQPNLPVRSAVVVAALVHPQWLVEIEVTAVRP